MKKKESLKPGKLTSDMTDKLDKTKIMAFCHRQPIPVDLLNETDSTSDYLRRENGREPRICIADSQTAGKGQKGRVWHSPPGVNIYFSYRHVFQNNGQPIPDLSLLVCAVVREIIQVCMPEHPLEIKWPNDILCQGKKLAGILTELQTRTPECLAIIGIGINVNMLPNKNHLIDQPWTSIRAITGKTTDRNQLCAELIQKLSQALPVI